MPNHVYMRNLETHLSSSAEKKISKVKRQMQITGSTTTLSQHIWYCCPRVSRSANIQCLNQSSLEVRSEGRYRDFINPPLVLILLG